MNRDELPETPAQLHDLLQTMFGIGTYDDLTSRVPWFRARMTEIMKLRSMIRKRRTTVADVAITAWYAYDRGLPISRAWQIFEHIPAAKRALRERDAEVRAAGLTHLRHEAVIEAMSLGEQSWADQLISASERDIAGVIDQWRNR